MQIRAAVLLFIFLSTPIYLPCAYSLGDIHERGYKVARQMGKDRTHGKVVGQQKNLGPFLVPEDEQNPLLEFIAVGCAGTGRVGQFLVADEIATLAYQENIDFILYLGDNFYPEGVKSIRDTQWRSKFEQVYDKRVLNLPFYAILGNHDYFENYEAQMEYAHTGNQRWRMPAAYYRLNKKINEVSTDLLGLDTTMLIRGKAYQDETTWHDWFNFFHDEDEEARIASKAEIQKKWFERQLKLSKADWKIVFGHHPLFTGDRKRRGDLQKFQAIALNTLTENNADLYISAHSHTLEVLKPVGSTHFVVSGAGAKARDKVYWTKDHLYAGAELGFVWFRVFKEKIDVIVVGLNQEIKFVYTIEK